MSDLRIRRAARAVILDDADRILLVRFEFPSEMVWATVGGGLEMGETHEDAIRREIAEEAGLEITELGPEVWTRTHVVPLGDRWDGQAERYYLVRTKPFEPRPRLSLEQLRDEGLTAIRWWTLGELDIAKERFAPRRLPTLLRRLIEDGPPAEPLDVGV